MKTSQPDRSGRHAIVGLNSMTGAQTGLPRLTTLAESLATSAVRSSTTEAFIRAAGQTLFRTPLKVERIFVSLKTLHPANRARTYLWRHRTDAVEVVEWQHGLRNRPGYYDSPDYHVHQTRTEFRVNAPQAVKRPRCEPYTELKADGYTDYLMVPLFFGDGTVNTLAVATSAPGRFAASDLDRFRALTDTFAVILERYAALETMASTLETYLGRSAGEKVLRGQIRAGHGELVKAAILFADMQGFTGHASRLDAAGTVRLVNDYFDCLVGPIEENGGHVLKFIGDAVLAFFPVVAGTPEPAPLAAVQTIRRRLTDLNRARQGQGEPPVHHGLCLHFGEVLYGNVGSTERLDFTIIGQAVNVAARGAETTRALGQEYVFTGDFVRKFEATELVHVDTLDFKGITQPVQLFTLAAVSGDDS